MSPSDILTALYQSTNGDAWTSNSNWLTNISVCNWHGVTCNGDIVTELYLSYNNLRGTIPTEIGRLSGLQKLDMSYTYLGGTIPTEIGRLSGLQNLELTYTYLGGTIPTEIGDMSSLQKLDMSYSYLAGTIPTEIGRLSGLQIIYLDSNKLIGTMPSEVCSLRDGALGTLRADCVREVSCDCCTHCY